MTGRTPAYEALGRSRCDGSSAPGSAGSGGDAACDGFSAAAEVFAYATDPARFSQWQKGVVDGHMDGPGDGTGTPAVGAKCVTTRRIGGASRPSTSELTHIDPPRGWGVRGTDGPIRAAVEVLVEPVTGSRSRLTISVDFTGHGIGKILVPLMVRREARKEMPANMAALKQNLEAG